MKEEEAGYQQLHQKLNELKVPAAGQQWAGMQAMLNAKMPAAAATSAVGLGAKLISLLKYFIPAIVVAGVTTYLVLPTATHKRSKTQVPVHQTTTVQNPKDSLVDTANNVEPNNTIVISGTADANTDEANTNTTEHTAAKTGTKTNAKATLEGKNNTVRDASDKTTIGNKALSSTSPVNVVDNNNGNHTANYNRLIKSHNVTTVTSVDKVMDAASIAKADRGMPGKVNPSGRNNTNLKASRNLNVVEKGVKHVDAVYAHRKTDHRTLLRPEKITVVKNGRSGRGSSGKNMSAVSNSIHPAKRLKVQNFPQQINYLRAGDSLGISPASLSNNFGQAETPMFKTVDPSEMTINFAAGKMLQITLVGPDKKLSKADSAKAAKSKTAGLKHFSFGLEGGTRAGTNSQIYYGGYFTYVFTNRLLIDAGMRINTSQQVGAQLTHASYYRPDSIPPFKLSDARTFYTYNLPITAEYRLTKNIAVKAGAFANLIAGQSNINTTLGTVPNTRDTLGHGSEVKNAINNTGFSTKLSLGFTGGVSAYLGNFYLHAGYNALSPYNIGNSLGSYSVGANAFVFGIGFRFIPVYHPPDK